MTDKDQKELMKEALKEWMDDQYAKFGKFILGKLIWAAVLGVFAWYLSRYGLKFP